MKSISNYSLYHHLCIHVMFILLLHDFVLLFIVLLFLLVCNDVNAQKSTLLLISKSSTFKGNPLKGSQSKLLSLLSNLFFKNKASVLEHFDPILRTQYSLLACLYQYCYPMLGFTSTCYSMPCNPGIGSYKLLFIVLVFLACM